MIKEILNNYKSNLPVILLIVYSLGYVYLNRYFSRFDITIEHYIDLTDILFFTVTSLIELAIVFFIIEVIMWVITYIILINYYRLINRKFLKKIERYSGDNEMLYDRYYRMKVDLPFNNYFRDATGVIFFLIAVVLFFWSEEYLLVSSIALPFLVVKVYSSIKRQEKREEESQVDKNITEHRYKKSLTFIVALTATLIFYFAVVGYKDGNLVKSKNFYSSPLEFVHDSVTYSTADSTFNFVGETSTYLFLYNYSNQKTYVFNKGSISKIKILDPAIKENADWNEAQKNSEQWEKSIKEFFKSEQQ